MKAGDHVAGRYRVQSRLGAGGMGVVYLARDEKLDRDVALKALSSRELGDTRGRTRLLREARAAARLEHPGIVQIHDVFETDEDGAFIVMERVRGRSLRALLDEGPLAPRRVAEIVVEVASALAAAHEAGVIHRDVKPDNVMVRDDGRVVVLDFGLVKDAGSDETSISRSPTLEELTRSGAVIGTPAYLAPEQARGKAVAASDQFALGVVAYELLTGRLPWRAETLPQLLAMILMDDPTPATEVAPELPADVDEVLARALAKTPQERFEDVGAFAEAFFEATAADDARDTGAEASGEGAGASRHEVTTPSRLGSSSGEGSTGGSPSTRSAPWLGRALAVGAIVAAVAGGLLWQRLDGAPEETGGTAEARDGSAPPLRFGESTIACPQLDVRGDDAGAWLGAAVASDICAYLWIALGAPPAHAAPPAALFDLPVQPTDDSPMDPYSEEGARSAQIVAARAMDAWIDGFVEPEENGLRAEVVVRGSDGRAIGPPVVVTAQAVELGMQIVRALRDAGALPRDEALPTELASLIGVDTVPSAVTLASAVRQQVLSAESDQCREIRSLSDVHANAAVYLPEGCRPSAVLDAIELDDHGRFSNAATALRASAAARASFAAGDVPLAQAEARRSMHAWPAGPGRRMLFTLARHTDSAMPAYRSLTHWVPETPDAWTHFGSELEPGSDLQLELTRRGYTLHPHVGTSADLATLLMQRGRREEVRNIAARLLERAPRSVLGHTLLAAAEAGAGRFGDAFDRLDALVQRDDWLFGTFENQEIAFVEVLGNLRVLTGSADTVDAFVRRVLLADPPRFDPRGSTWRLRSAVVLCALASDPVRGDCVARLNALRDTEYLVPASPGSEDLLDGVTAWHHGDVRAAALQLRRFTELRSAWDVGVFALVVSPILDAAGEHELADRLDRTAIEAGDHHFNGASAATVRTALRADALGDRDRAATLARRAVDALGSADVEIAHLDELRRIAAGAP